MRKRSFQQKACFPYSGEEDINNAKGSRDLSVELLLDMNQNSAQRIRCLRIDHEIRFVIRKVYINDLEVIWSYAKERFIKLRDVFKQKIPFYFLMVITI